EQRRAVARDVHRLASWAAVARGATADGRPQPILATWRLAPRLRWAPRMARTWLCFIVAALATSFGCVGDDPGADDANADDTVDVNPPVIADNAQLAFHGRFGSPSIVRDGDVLHAYFAMQQFQGDPIHVAHARSNDGGETWLRLDDALPRLNVDAVKTG